MSSATTDQELQGAGLTSDALAPESPQAAPGGQNQDENNSSGQEEQVNQEQDPQAGNQEGGPTPGAEGSAEGEASGPTGAGGVEVVNVQLEEANSNKMAEPVAPEKEQVMGEMPAPPEVADDPLSLVGAAIDSAALKVGRAYGRMAVQFPVLCISLGCLIPLLFAIPFFIALGDGQRGPTQIGKGFVFRGDYDVFSPSESDTSKKYDTIKQQITGGRISYKEAIGDDTWKGRDYGVKDYETQCLKKNLKTGKSDGDAFAFLFRMRNKPTGTNAGLCETPALQELWNFEQYVQTRRTKKGNAWRPDFCPFNTKMDYKTTSQWHRAACGTYKGEHIHPVCKYSGSVYVSSALKRGCQCADAGTVAAADVCNTARMTAAYGVRTIPYCRADPLSGCMDLVTEADGQVTSQAACLQSTTQEGVPSDQMDHQYWCATDSWLSTIGLANPLLGELSCSTNDPRHFGAMLNYTAAPLVGVWDGPTRLALSNFPVRTFMSGYMGSLLMKVVHEDIRDASVQADCTAPDAAAGYTSTTCPVQPIKAMLQARGGRQRMLQEVDELDEEERAALRKLTTYSYGNCTDDETALAAIIGKPSTVNSCADVTAAMCLMRSYSKCDEVGNACKARCESLAPGFCAQLEPAFMVGQQDQTQCSTYGGDAALQTKCAYGAGANTTAEEECRQSCLAIGCQHTKLQTYLDLLNNRYDLAAGAVYLATGNPVSAINAAGAGKLTPGCHSCVDTSERIAFNSAVQTVGCDGVPEKACKCAADVGGCTIKPEFLNKMTAEMCPQTCTDHADSCANPAVHTWRDATKDATNAATVLGGRAAVATFPTKCQGCLAYLASDRKFAPYRISNCETFLTLVRLRSECELNRNEWRRVSNRNALSLEDREEWVDEIIEEYKDNYGIEKDDDPPSKSQWKALYDRGIDVFIFHSKWLAMEIVRVITNEIGNLVGTFFLMIFFLICAIGIRYSAEGGPNGLKPARTAVAALVVIQPILAVLFSWGIGAIEMWDAMGGDVDKDGEDDGVLALTVMSPLAIHLLLAIVVDYDIILVRAYDRLTPKLKFEERMEQAVGYAHRSILLSCLAIFVGYCFGSIVEVLALRHFCWHTALGMIGLYITLFTVFLGGFVLAEKYGGEHLRSEETGTTTASNWTDKQVQQNMGKLLTTTSGDAMFSKIVSNKICIAFVICVEIALLCVGAVMFEDVKVEFNGKDYLDKESKARKFLDHLEDMGGYSDFITVYMPPSHLGKYHQQANRDYFLGVMNQIKNDPISNPVGVPGVFSWLEEFEVHHKGLYGNFLASEPLSAATHLGCKVCPMNLIMNTGNKRLPFIANPAQNIALLNGAAGPTNTLFTGTSKRGRNSFRFTGINDAYLNGLLTAQGVNTTDTAAKLQAVGLGFPELAMVGGGGYELAEVYNGGFSATAPANALDQYQLLYSMDPVSPQSDISQFADMNALLAHIANNVTVSPVPNWLIFTMRALKDEKYNLHNTFSTEKQSCPAFTQSHYEKRTAYWEDNPQMFYEYMHAWYEDVNQDACCTSHMPPTHVQQKPDITKPHVSYWGREQGRNIVWAMQAPANGNGRMIEGMTSSTVRIACRAPLDPKKRTDAMKRIKAIIDNARSARPDLWGSESDSFVVSSFFENSERDDEMLDKLTEYLFVVTLAVTIMMMLFLHPYYGLMIGVLMLVVNVQIVGLLSAFDVKLDVIVFAVIIMALGFEIEYSIHIVHAFAYSRTTSGGGLARTETAVQDMGLTVFTAFLSTAVQQLVLLIFSTSLAFEIYPAMVILVVVKSGLAGFVFAPAFLGLLDAVKGMIMPDKAEMKELAGEVAAEGEGVEMAAP
ncbi:unnamed protein product [Amoebophrya sp. A120]|nr:unnamed protein product [Amoebophrya sp. A120]|eukprot:GSA120T00024934001.1